MIKEFEFYHGAALARLVHTCPSKITICAYPSPSNASYILNGKVGVYIKHSTKRLTPWRFSFQKIHQEEIMEMKSKLDEVFILLVCKDDGIVALDYNELKQILDETHEEIEWISASRMPNKEYTVKGSDGGLNYKISKNDFPRKVLAATEIIEIE